MKKIDKLKQDYESACNDYLHEFCIKQSMKNGGWVGGHIGRIAICSFFFFSMQDIVWDINSKQKVGLIINWYHDCLGNVEKSVNYYSYTHGLKLDDFK